LEEYSKQVIASNGIVQFKYNSISQVIFPSSAELQNNKTDKTDKINKINKTNKISNINLENLECLEKKGVSRKEISHIFFMS